MFLRTKNVDYGNTGTGMSILVLIPRPENISYSRTKQVNMQNNFSRVTKSFWLDRISATLGLNATEDICLGSVAESEPKII